MRTRFRTSSWPLALPERQQIFGSPDPLAFNGVPYKAAANVQSSDSVSQQLRAPASFSGKLGPVVNLANAATFGALNTQGLSMARIDYKLAASTSLMSTRAVQKSFTWPTAPCWWASSPPRLPTSSSTRPSTPGTSLSSRVASFTSRSIRTKISPPSPSPPSMARTREPLSWPSPSLPPTLPFPRLCWRPPLA
ncbi:hypothetical protein L7F22_066667 [Adiantum nelumboides]|nr:hypothetical protein [Adiantum nelumboides]